MRTTERDLLLSAVTRPAFSTAAPQRIMQSSMRMPFIRRRGSI